jgi:hypothetical protein
MSHAAVLLPVFVQVALTFALLFWMGSVRRQAISKGETQIGDIALGQPGWPERPTQIARAFHNQLETPQLFYVLVALAMVTQKADLLFVVMAWAFVLARLAHAYVHVTSNDVYLRFKAYGAGLFVLMGMWAIFAIRIMGKF